MHIKQQVLAQQLEKNIAPLYVLVGQDIYLLNESLATIKSALKKNHEYDERVISILRNEDWDKVQEEANSYSLFADTVLLNILFDKKSLDAFGKKILTNYLSSPNSRCFIIITAPNIPVRHLQWLPAEQAVICVAYPLNSLEMNHWIATQFKKNFMAFDPQVPELICQYTQGNMLACAQVIEKICLSYPAHSLVSLEQAQEHLSDQCELQLFELIDACLLGQTDKAIHILRRAAHNKTEATLVLWILSQEIRILMQLSHLLQQKIDIKNACNQLKIWPQRLNFYKKCFNRLDKHLVQQLHHYCCSIDEQIKSAVTTQVWNSLEQLTLSICLGQLIGETCKA